MRGFDSISTFMMEARRLSRVEFLNLGLISIFDDFPLDFKRRRQAAVNGCNKAWTTRTWAKVGW